MQARLQSARISDEKETTGHEERTVDNGKKKKRVVTKERIGARRWIVELYKSEKMRKWVGCVG